ncbi:BTAD domain-containing putative transcriptional regulator [Actinomycetes bacterium KLBMP 9797]
MLLNLDHPVSREAIIEALWAGTAPSTAKSQVHNAITVIRGRLAELGAEDVFAGGPSGYQLLVEPERVDVAVFTARVREARTAAGRGDHAAAARLLREGLALWTGEPLADASGAFVDAARARLVERRLTAYEDLADAELELGRAEAVVAEIAPLVDRHPMRERLRARQMTALYRSGRQVEALQSYRAYRALLAEHEGLDPGREIAELESVILRAEAPPLRTELDKTDKHQTPALLPPDIPDFTGREREVDAVHRLLTEPRQATALAVAAIAGMGGIGKTTLAVRAAHLAAPAYPDGQLYVNLRGAEASPVDPADVLARFLRALGVDGRAVPHDPLERAEMYRSRLAGRRVLVVLDNAASEEQIRPLLPGAPTCAVLATSRARLTGVEGARWIDLDVFATDDAIALLAQVTADDRVARERADAAEIVRLCGGLPLAVRVAGARLTARPTWRLAHLARLLGDERRRLDRLATGDLEVRASLALSYDGLDPDARRLFRLLGLFDAPHFPAWLAPAVLAMPADDAAIHLETLVDAQLVAESGPDAAGQQRYRLHDLVRLFARERAEREDPEPDRAAALAQGLGGWLAAAERMADRVPGPCYWPIGGSAPRPDFEWLDEPDDPLVWFDAERSTLISAVHQACRLGLDELAFDLAGRMEKYFDIRGLYVDWRALNTKVIEVCQRTGNLRGEAVMLRGLTDVVTWNTMDATGEAMTRFEADARRMLEMFTTLEEWRGASDAAVNCSWALAALGAYPEAEEFGARALRLAEENDHVGGEARAHVALAVVCGERRDLAGAFAHLTRALERARTLGNPRYEAAVLQFMGIGYGRAGDLDASERALEESLVITRRYRDRYTEVLTMLELARLYLHRGDPRARGAAEKSLALGRQFNMSHHVADSLGVLGEIELADGQPERAAVYLAESVALWRTRGWLSFLAEALVNLGRALTLTDPPAAKAAVDEAREIFGRLGNTARVADLDALA